ncbi:hypothetical protein BDR03DRAFT_937145 [Suillus americanus]|nr:hypothetical protein BDR03DRAFT_937145 [Suillus americanus]
MFAHKISSCPDFYDPSYVFTQCITVVSLPWQPLSVRANSIPLQSTPSTSCQIYLPPAGAISVEIATPHVPVRLGQNNILFSRAFLEMASYMHCTVFQPSVLSVMHSSLVATLAHAERSCLICSYAFVPCG